MQSEVKSGAVENLMQVMTKHAYKICKIFKWGRIKKDLYAFEHIKNAYTLSEPK